jgi:hypothetical protein
MVLVAGWLLAAELCGEQALSNRGRMYPPFV